MKFLREHIAFSIFVLFAVFVLASIPIKSYIAAIPIIKANALRESLLANEYNNGEKIFYLPNPNDFVGIGKKMVQLPWGINKTELKQLYPNLTLLEESDKHLIVGPSPQNIDKIFVGEFIEYYFNESGQLYKVIETSGLKYIYVEYNPNVVEKYENLQENIEFPSYYGFFNEKVMSCEYHIDLPYTISWKDSNGIEKTAVLNWLDYLEIYKATGLVVDTSDLNKMVLDNDLTFSINYRGGEGTNVIFEYVVKEMSKDVVYGEITLTNTLLEDK